MKSAELAVISEEKSDATGVLQWPFLVLTVKFICSERSSPSRFAKILLAAVFGESVRLFRCIREPGWPARIAAERKAKAEAEVEQVA